MVWCAAVAASLVAPAIARSELPRSALVATAWLIVTLSILLWLLSTTPRKAIKLPSIASELVVLGGMVTLHLWLFHRPGWTPLFAALIVIINHTAKSAQGAIAVAPRSSFWSRVHLYPAFNLWPMAPMLWHPSLWPTTTAPILSRAAWSGFGLCVVAGLGAGCAQRSGSAARVMGWGLWLAAAGLTLVFI